MSKLILSLDGLVLKEIKLDKERTMLGRKPHNDIQIDNLAVSGEHAVVITVLNDSFLEDLNSTNGTMVNGSPIKKHFLQNNDVIEIGKYKLKYVNEMANQAPTPDFEKTMMIRSPVAKPVPEKKMTDTMIGQAQALSANGPAPTPATAPAPAEPAVQPPLAAIQILTGGNAGKELELTKNLTTLGKPGVQVAVIAKRPHGYFITHVEGANFPVVNGKQLDSQAHQLSDHDVIELAGVKMEFFVKN